MKIILGVGLAGGIFLGFMLTWLGLGLVHTSGAPAWVMAGIGALILWTSASKLRGLFKKT